MATVLKYTMKLFIILVTVALAASCSPKGAALQEYLVESSEKQEFIALDIASSIFKVDETTLSADEKDVYKSIKKINLLMLSKDKVTADAYTAENEKVKTILANDDFEKLISVNDKDFKAKLYFIGTTDAIDEVILYGSSPEKGFAIARILGDNMKPENMKKLAGILQKSDVNEGALAPLKQFFQ